MRCFAETAPARGRSRPDRVSTYIATPPRAPTAFRGLGTRASGGPLVWSAAIATAVAAYAVAAWTGRADILVAGGLAVIVPLIFAVRLEAGLLLVVLLRPTLDVFAERTFASFA